ncbi:MAG: hypothetical protein ABIJ12_06245 [bacterium]
MKFCRERETFLRWLRRLHYNFDGQPERSCNLFNADNILLTAKLFLYAGSTVLLLLISQLYSDFRFLSFFALIPLLVKVFKCKMFEAVLLGILFGFIYFTINSLQITDHNLIHIIIMIVFGILLSICFTCSVFLTREKFGLNPFMISILWIVFEFILIKLGFINSLLGEENITQGYFYGISVFFGFLIISLIIVFLNILIIFAIDIVLCWAKSRRAEMPSSGRIWNLYTNVGFFADNYYLKPDSRGPPVIIYKSNC